MVRVRVASLQAWDSLTPITMLSFWKNARDHVRCNQGQMAGKHVATAERFMLDYRKLRA